jgi:hypothetical protein
VFVRNIPACCNTDTTQFADDITPVKPDADIQVVMSDLIESFGAINEFSEYLGLKVNAEKTQLIVLKASRRKILPDVKMVIGDKSIKPVKLLGVHLDQHFNMSVHIDMVVKKCHGWFGALF